MDSLTQAALGAAVGEAVLGRRIGNKAILLGAAFGTLPDLDVVVSPFVDAVGFLVHHRAWSHSLLMTVVLSPVLAALFRRVGNAGFARWCHFFFWVFLTHILLDCCTSYGTQIFWPLADTRVAWNSIFIIDPLYTVPLLLGLLLAMMLRRDSVWRWRVNVAGLAVSTVYMAFAFGAKAHVGGVIEASLAKQKIPHTRYMTCPTPLNTVLWYAVAEGREGFHVATYSLLDASRDVAFDFVPRGEATLGPMTRSWPVDRLIWFANGYYAVEPSERGAVLRVLKFGRFSLEGNRVAYPFAFAVGVDGSGEVVVNQLPFARGASASEMASGLWSRMLRQVE